jgi:hypothetical protein
MLRMTTTNGERRRVRAGEGGAMGDETAFVSRRGILAGGAALTAAVVAGVEVGAAAPAGAAAAVIRKTTQYRVVSYRYNATTHVTTVTKATKVTVVARFAGGNVYLKNARGVWTQVPYVWSSAKKGLVFSRYLQLRIAAAAQYAKDVVNPAAGARTVAPKSFASVATYASTDWSRHLLRRAGYGPTPADLADVKQLGYVGWLEHQLSPSLVPDAACVALLSSLPNQATPIWKVKFGIENGDINGYYQQVGVETDFAARALWSKRQLLTVMEDFWGNHFNVTIFADGTDSSRAHYAYTIRTHALGRFADLLAATSTHPAMLTYLNNRDSTASHPNENQGRELLELHTVGVDASYGETGVLNSARILTGLGVDSDSGEFAYQPWNHWTGSVNVLGFSHANSTDVGGLAVARAYMLYLARHPATAKRIAHKLAVRFVSDNPSTSLVNLLAATYTKHDTAIVPVLRVLFSSAEFAHSIGAKVQRPFEHLISVARLLQVSASASSTKLDAATTLLRMAENAGHNPFGQPFPTGQADTADHWESTAATLTRWNNAQSMVNGYPSDVFRPSLVKVAVGDVDVAANVPATHGALVDVIAARLFGKALAADHKAAMLTYLGVTAATPIANNTAPALTYQLSNFVSVLMDSPYQMLK